MKDTMKLLFERNKYFTGKLLSANDFSVEQKYFNDKRRLINMFMFGSGVLYGLDVINTGDWKKDESISIKPGIAVDSMGREIVIPDIETRILSEIEGFPEDGHVGAIYLCLEYDEKNKDEASAIEDSDSKRQDVKKYNRVQEGYRLFFNKKPPQSPSFGSFPQSENVNLIYEDSTVMIWHRAPKYFIEDEIFEASFICIKLQKDVRVKLDYKISTDSLHVPDGKSRNLCFECSDKSEKTELEYKYFLIGGQQDGKIVLNKDNIRINIGDRPINIDRIEISLISKEVEVKDIIAGDYRNKNMIDYINSMRNECIYLSKIFITHTISSLGMRYHIDDIENTIFTRYIKNIKLTDLYLKSKPKRSVNNIDFTLAMSEAAPAMESVESYNKTNIATGVINITMEGSYKKHFISEEIEHGLGNGPVFITAGIEDSKSDVISGFTQNNDAIYLGAHDVFRKSPYESEFRDASIGVIVYPNKGSFRVGVNLTGVAESKTVNIRWWAIRG